MAKDKSKKQPKAKAKITIKAAAKPVKSAKTPAKVAMKVQSKDKKAKPVAKVAAKVTTKTTVKIADKSSLIVKVAKKELKTVLKKAEDVVKKVLPEKAIKDKKEAAAPIAVSKPSAKDAKIKAKSKKAEKKEANDLDDDFTLDDDFGDSEISDYEEDLKNVEEQDEEENLELTDDDEEETKDEEVYLTDSEGRRLCRVRDCDQVANVEGYCRYHYLLLWKKIQVRKSILQDGKLEKYVEDLTARYPDKFLEMIKKDLKSEKDFLAAIQELEIDESALSDIDGGDDETQSFADEIRGIGDAPSLDDDGDY